MSIKIVITTNEIFDDGTIKQWKKDHPYADSYSELQEVPLRDQGGLFSEDPGSIVKIEKFLAGDIRKINRETKRDILIISEKKTNANFSKDGIDVVNLLPPDSDKKLVDFIVSHVDISKKNAARCVKMSDSPESALILARQASYNDSNSIPWSYLYNPFKGESLPWDMFKAITSSYPDMAVIETEKMINDGTDPTTLMFQIIGYFKKVIMSKNDIGGVLADNNRGWFLQTFRKIEDVEGLIDDLNYYHDVILNDNKKARFVILAFVASLSTRFKRW